MRSSVSHLAPVAVIMLRCTAPMLCEDSGARRRVGICGSQFTIDGPPVLINEDGVSTFNLHAPAQERIVWDCYDRGSNEYPHGFDSPPTNWRISGPVKWLLFEQVARLTGSSMPGRPEYESDEAPFIQLMGIEPGQVVEEPIWVASVVEDRHPRWPIKRVELFIDGKPHSYRRNAPYVLGSWKWWDPSELSPGQHVLAVYCL